MNEKVTIGRKRGRPRLYPLNKDTSLINYKEIKNEKNGILTKLDLKNKRKNKKYRVLMIKPSNLFKNPEGCSKLVLKKSTNNNQVGYNKIIKGDLTYNELYKDPDEDDFLCCREYKSYVNNLINSHKIENCDFDHKNVLEYLREVALNELSDFQPEVESQNTCRDTFCDQCNVCLVAQQGFNINK